MKPPQAENSSRPLDADAHVAADLPCGSCGYNLRTLSLAGACPECAWPVRRSMVTPILSCADAVWVRQLARGVLLLLVAAGVFYVGYVFLYAPMPGLPPLMSPRSIPLTAHGLVGGLDQIAWRAGVMALAMLALWTLTKPDPANPTRTERVSARRLLRACICLWPVPLVLTLMATQGMSGRFVYNSLPSGFVMLKPLFAALTIATGMAAATLFVVTPLALLHYLAALMRRVPRPRLARFCRVLFWGVLVSGAALLAGYAWIDLRVMVWTVTVPMAGFGANPPPLPPRPLPGVDFTMAWYAAAIGWRAMILFLSAGLVLLFLVQRALAEAAREAGRAESESVPIVSLAGSP